jgi:hypothetical protein
LLESLCACMPSRKASSDRDLTKICQ